MKKAILALALALCCSCSTAAKEDTSIEVNFSPNGGAAEAVVREINLARKSVLIQAYSFTNPQIGAALAAAHDRGVPGAVDASDLRNGTAGFHAGLHGRHARLGGRSNGGG